MYCKKTFYLVLQQRKQGSPSLKAVVMTDKHFVTYYSDGFVMSNDVMNDLRGIRNLSNCEREA